MLPGMDEITEQPAETQAIPAASDGTTMEDRRPPEPIDPAHAAVVERGMEQARRGLLASPDDVEAVFRRADP